MKKILFMGGYEYEFYRIYRMLPFDMIEQLVLSGNDRDYACEIVQRIIDNIHNHEREMHFKRKKQEEEWKHYIEMASNMNPFVT